MVNIDCEIIFSITAIVSAVYFYTWVIGRLSEEDLCSLIEFEMNDF